MRRGTTRCVLALLLLAATTGAAGCGSSRSPAPAAPQPADVAGVRGRIAAAHGHPVLVAFWATWCHPCVEELPALVALQQSSAEHVEVVAVSLDGFLSGQAATDVVTAFLRTNPAPLVHMVYTGSQDELFRAFDLPGGIPYSILYDGEGRELRRFDGATSVAEVRSALAAQPSGADPGSRSGSGAL